ncbi:DUF4190 domain-containing protein [Arthrobacter bussei]|jgi:hypothetical protein|uniref:DUF4190 domain-containing protein n=1 Tax=Arthrobacter bussei TaxID=2594179 RepID=A0A7X1TPQ3_9MICC|nr:DUF4190 domain-containing protein [Arthrobacter bussei]MPY11903.1 hypothetical protein [Arthrobacter bussei]
MSDNNPGSQGSSPYGQQNQPQYGQNQPQYGQNAPQYGEQSPTAYGQQQGQSPYGQQGGNNYPGQQGYQGQVTENPGRTLGIVGFILAILIAPVGLIISIVAFVKSRRAKMGNGFALAGIIIGILFTIIGTILIIVIASFTAELTQQLLDACQGQPSGTPVTIQGQSTSCP